MKKLLLKFLVLTMVFTSNATTTKAITTALDAKDAENQDLPQAQPQAAPSTLAATAEKPPNVLFFFADQLSTKALELYGSDFACPAPNIDALASRGVTFMRSYCTTPLCTPARASLLTGLFPSKTDLVENIDGDGSTTLVNTLSSKFYTSAHYFKDKGYDTAYSGKWHLSPGSNSVVSSGFNFSGGDGTDPTKTNNFFKFLDTKNSDKPWYGVVSYIQPHDIYFPTNFGYDAQLSNITGYENMPLPLNNVSPTNVPTATALYRDQFGGGSKSTDDYIKRYRKFYMDLVKILDDEVGRVIQKLKDTGDYDNTIIVFSSDHGDMLGTHKTFYKGPVMYEELASVPFIISYPGVIPEGEKRDSIISGVDLFPTLTDLVFNEVPKGIDGVSVKKTIFDKDIVTRDNAIIEFNRAGQIKIANRILIKKDHKIAIHINGDKEMYDTKNDPYELTNVINDPSYATVKQSLLNELTQKMTANNDPYLTKYTASNIDFRYFDQNPNFNRTSIQFQSTDDTTLWNVRFLAEENDPILKTVRAGEQFGYIPPAPKRLLYNFDGWYMDSTYTTPYSPTLINSDTTVYAKWLAKPPMKTIKYFNEEFDSASWATNNTSFVPTQSSNYILTTVAVSPDTYTLIAPSNGSVASPSTATLVFEINNDTNFDTLVLNYNGRVINAGNTNGGVGILDFQISTDGTNYQSFYKNEALNQSLLYTFFKKQKPTGVDVTIPFELFKDNKKVYIKAIITTVGMSGWACLDRLSVTGLSPVLSNPEYSVTFDSKGGTAVSNILTTTGTITLPTAPTKQGFTFAGWYKDTALTQAFDGTGITSNTTVYAKWAPVIIEYILGDVNDDKSIDVNDVLIVLQHVTSKVALEGEAFTAGDVNKDKVIDVIDAMIILQRISGKISNF